MDKTTQELLAKSLAAQQELLKAISGDGDTLDKVGSANTAVRLHGSGGIFAISGTEREVISAHSRPQPGIMSVLPLLPSNDENPRYASLTGFQGYGGSQPSNVCDEAPKGYMKGAYLTARFGQLRFDTNTIDMTKLKLQLNRGDFTDLTLYGQVLGNAPGSRPQNMSQEQILNSMVASEMVTVGVLYERELSRQIWQGSFLVATEFPGLDVQIATGQKDAETGTLAPALDSDVKSYGYGLLSSSIVNYLSMLEIYLKRNADTMGLNPVKWAVVMRPDLWYELTAIWPCAYNTTKCAPAVATNSTVFIDGRENTAERDAMRNGMYIDINGTRYPVLLDTGIFEHNSTNNANCGAGQYASTIYMVPLTILGGFPVTYRQFVDYRSAGDDLGALRNTQSFWTDNGVFSWATNFQRWCFDMSAVTQQRVVLRTPQLAGRIDAVKYAPLQHLRDSDPSSAYFMDGGVSVRGAMATPYAVWSGR